MPSSRFRWVRRCSPNRFQARPWVGRTHVNLGTYSTEGEAAMAVRRFFKSGARSGHVLPPYVRRRHGAFFGRKRVGGVWHFFGPFDSAERAERAVVSFLRAVGLSLEILPASRVA